MFSAVLMRSSVTASQRCFVRQPVRNFRPRRPTTKVEPHEVEVSKVDPVIEIVPRQSPSESNPPKSILGKYFLYTAVTVPTFFTGCAIWNYESVRKFVRRQTNPFSKPSQKRLGFREHINVIWNHQFSKAQKMFIVIATVNTAVFLLWRVPRFTPLMSRYFLCMPTKAHSVVSSTLSAFSHMGAFHLFANMYVLYSFCVPLCQILGAEQFLAVYLSGATFAGLTSCVHRLATKRMIPSLGASGAVLTVLAIMCQLQPQSRLSIAFVNEIFPHSFSAQSGLFGLIALDCIGLLLGWRVLDHAAHLGGVIFGLLYIQYGQKLIWEKYRKNMLKQWHAIREK